MRRIDVMLEQYRNDPLGLLDELDGLYLRPSPKAPLVGYAGTYTDKDGQSKNYVGEIYANFAKAEACPAVVDMWAGQLWSKEGDVLRKADVFLGAPEGGKALAYSLAVQSLSGYAYPKVRETPVVGSRPKKEFIWDRHILAPGSKVVVVEDVANNFTTTGMLIDLILRADCVPVALVCLLNRSPDEKVSVYAGNCGDVPIISLVSKPMPEYKQDDPFVAEDIAKGNVVLKPRETPATWQQLKDWMIRT